MMMSSQFTTTGTKMKPRALALISSIFILVAIVLGSLLYTSYDKAYFASYQRDKRIDLEAGLEQDELDKVTGDLLAYLKKGDNKLLKPHFNEKEILHMEDVFTIYEGGRLLFVISLALGLGLSLLGYRTFKSQYLISLGSSLLIAGLIIAAFLGVLFMNFSESFIKFHHIFFDNDLWLLDPKTDLMIRMLPEYFFKDLVFRVIAIGLGIFVLVEGGVLLLGKKSLAKEADS